MNFSKVLQKCTFCSIGKGIYCCPKCKSKYCSSYCYKSEKHKSCSELFYRDWVESTIYDKAVDPDEKKNMFKILEKFEEESKDSETFMEPSLEEKLSVININDASESEILNTLSKKQKNEFEAFISNEENLVKILKLKKPWWSVATLNLVFETDIKDLHFDDEVAARPPYPLISKKLSELTSKPPSDCIKHNLINILYSYAFLFKFYNCDFRDFTEEVIKSFLELSPVLSENRNYFSLEESIQDSIRLISISDYNVPLTLIKNIVYDVRDILNGPTNARPATFVMCALHDIKLLSIELRCMSQEGNTTNKQLKKKLMLFAKKLEFFVCWSMEYESTFSELASDIVLIMMPDLIPDSKCNVENSILQKQTNRLLIEEIE